MGRGGETASAHDTRDAWQQTEGPPTNLYYWGWGFRIKTAKVKAK
jgi:hypothetical protein